MSKYNDSFEFNPMDIDLIEQSIRHEIGALAGLLQIETASASPEHLKHESRIRKLQLVLGKIHHQKVWYGQTHHTGVPVTG